MYIYIHAYPTVSQSCRHLCLLLRRLHGRIGILARIARGSVCSRIRPLIIMCCSCFSCIISFFVRYL